MAVNIKPNREGYIIYDSDKLIHIFDIIQDVFQSSIVEHKYVNKNNTILRLQYKNCDTEKILYMDTNIKYYWHKTKKITSIYIGHKLR
ncbi:Uncharacterised protein [Bergeyella zoohelcum]|uniref:Uncharacterized protein n=2 Tax=Bergeyella zoohelcum TaxID=1015 RepID=K1MLH8_9FLAO|nr:hypothetical protein HMPREF9699_01262 [Bergeyella zoohelcum ATCC 43767]EKB60646.1 hypothetical protein HMPREF9700_00141 [Bergeyella zoohelcum CCUG 30536]SUV48558.1 Uncharacterised protein [Bergeyella zoohelcum]SUV52166.1 Uncharacterised protein [Bergeyella zoohelcum]VDH05796.1 Uncharacterised protein [Bergeyella zoohelcum]